MPEIPDVVGAATVESAWGNQIRDRTLQRYIDATARDASVPLPIAGELAYLSSTTELTVYDGTAWETIAVAGESYTKAEADARFLNLAGGAMTGSILWPEYTGAGGGIGVVDQGAGVGVALELGNHTAATGGATPFIDFHTGHTTNDYDARIIASGGVAGVVSGADIQVQCQDFRIEPRAAGNGHARSNRGFELTAYHPSPLGFGGDIFGAQTRNIIAVDRAPDNSEGLDGDVWLQYS